jgi:diguanylate cyclase (GGDEF)-like protein
LAPSSIRTRLLAVIAGIAVLASMAIGFSYALTEAERTDVEADRQTTHAVTELAAVLVGAVHEQEDAITDYLLSRDPIAVGRYRKAQDTEVRATERISVLGSELPDVVAAATALSNQADSWRRAFAEPVLVAVERGAVASIAALSRSSATDQEGSEELSAALRSRLEASYSAVEARDDSLVHTRALASAGSVILMLIAAVACAVLLRRWIALPLEALLGTAARVERGDDIQFEAQRNDEIGRLGLALERMRQALQGDAERSGVLNRFTEATTFAADDTAVADSNLQALRLLVSPDAAVTHVLNRSKDRAIPEATIGAAVAEVLPLNALSRCPGIVRGSVYVTPDVSEALAVHCPIYRIEQGTLACVPLAHGETVGAVHLAWDRVDAFPLELRASVAQIAEHAALAIANRRLLAALQGMASTDARTGLANTRAFDQALENELAARTGDESVAVLMLDLDRFKDFNDRHGHPAGDEALRAFADVLRSSLRERDLAARYGGEEFAVMLPGVDVGGALLVAERIRARCDSTLIPLGPGITDRVQVSIGVSSAPVQGRDRLTLLRLADEALYAAKQGGRNRVDYLGPREGSQPACVSRRRQAS